MKALRRVGYYVLLIMAAPFGAIAIAGGLAVCGIYALAFLVEPDGS
jgi:hypothetical protein